MDDGLVTVILGNGDGDGDGDIDRIVLMIPLSMIAYLLLGWPGRGILIVSAPTLGFANYFF